MTISKIVLLTTTSLLAFSGLAYAAESQQASENLEEIIVTGSRIERAGYQAPTPVTMTNADELQAAAKPTIGDYLSELPSFGAANRSTNPTGNTSGGNAGIYQINLRNLGVTRTLVLFDGRRVVNAQLLGGVDLGLIPDSLVQRIDVVTGGASAAWGSDAVAGVVNVIVNKEFQGVTAKVETTISDYGDGFNHKDTIAGGSSFADGKGHVVGSFSYSNTPGWVYFTDRPWVTATTIIPNPAFVAGNGQPKYTLGYNGGVFNETYGGLITGGPLKNTQFVGKGTPIAYNVISRPNVQSAGTNVFGDDADKFNQLRGVIEAPTKIYTVYSHVGYAVSDSINAELEINFGDSKGSEKTTIYPRAGNITIFKDNAYLPASIVAAMTANNITSFAFGKQDFDMGQTGTTVDRKLYRGVAALDGKIFTDWKWKAYYEYGRVRNYTYAFDDVLNDRFNLATDAVVNPANGQITCRSTLTNPVNGCVPNNVFGIGVASDAAKQWISGTKPYQVIHTFQHAAEVSISGSPLNSWAGPVDIATGLDWRREGADAEADALSIAKSYFAGNFDNIPPVSVSVKEAFGEVNVPLAKDQPWAKSLDLNAAVRVTNYSTSGTVVTWKAGLAYQATDEVRFRVTRSRDIRAPSMNDLFSPGLQQSGSIFDPFTNTTPSYRFPQLGNPNLNPEIGNTLTGGGVYSPAWLDGFQTSIDYYHIKVTDAIRLPVAQEILDGCFNKTFPQYCPFIIRNTSGVLTEIDLLPVNIAVATAAGIDFEASYRTAIGPGDASFRLLGSYQLEESSIQNGIYTDASGSFVGLTPNRTTGSSKLKVNAGVQYKWDPVTLGLDARYIGPAKLSTYLTSADISDADNHVAAMVVLNLRAAYDFDAFGSQSGVYISIDNLMNSNPPKIASLSSVSTSVNKVFYDSLGRVYRVGLRAKF